MNTFDSLFFPDQQSFSTDLEKKWAKRVQLVRVSFFRSVFLQNPYFSQIISLEAIYRRLHCLLGFLSEIKIPALGSEPFFLWVAQETSTWTRQWINSKLVIVVLGIYNFATSLTSSSGMRISWLQTWKTDVFSCHSQGLSSPLMQYIYLDSQLLGPVTFFEGTGSWFMGFFGG